MPDLPTYIKASAIALAFWLSFWPFGVPLTLPYVGVFIATLFIVL